MVHLSIVLSRSMKERRSRTERESAHQLRPWYYSVSTSLCSPPLSFLTVFPTSNAVTYRLSWKPAPIEMETQPWHALRIPLCLSFSFSLSFPNYLSLLLAASRLTPTRIFSILVLRSLQCEILFPFSVLTPLLPQSSSLVSVTHVCAES